MSKTVAAVLLQRQHLRLEFAQRRFDSSTDKLLDHFQPDESGSDHQRSLGLFAIDDGLDLVGVTEITE